jgi:hypothetical protein
MAHIRLHLMHSLLPLNKLLPTYQLPSMLLLQQCKMLLNTPSLLLPKQLQLLLLNSKHGFRLN